MSEETEKTERNKEPSGVECSRLLAPWKNVTSYSRGEKDRTPRTWTANMGAFKLVLTRHIWYEPDEWVAKCHGVFDERLMASKDLHEAATQAKAMLQVALENGVKAILEG